MTGEHVPWVRFVKYTARKCDCLPKLRVRIRKGARPAVDKSVSQYTSSDGAYPGIPHTIWSMLPLLLPRPLPLQTCCHASWPMPIIGLAGVLSNP